MPIIVQRLNGANSAGLCSLPGDRQALCFVGRKNAFILQLMVFYLIKMAYAIYFMSGCARWGASGALFPKSALRGAEFPLKGYCPEKIKPFPAGRRATDGHESRQVRKEAAINGEVCVVD